MLWFIGMMSVIRFVCHVNITGKNEQQRKSDRDNEGRIVPDAIM